MYETTARTVQRIIMTMQMVWSAEKANMNLNATCMKAENIQRTVVLDW